MKKILYKHITDNVDYFSWVTTHSLEVIFYKAAKGVEAHIHMLTQENYRALVHAADMAGLVIDAIHSADFSFNHIFSKNNNVSHVRIGTDHSRMILVEHGVPVSDYLLDISYSGLLDVVEKYHPQADDLDIILKQHGFLDRYDDQKMFAKIREWLRPLIQTIGENGKSSEIVYVSFEKYVIPGLIDALQKTFPKTITLLNPLDFPTHLQSDVLPIHRNEIPDYATCLFYLLHKK